MRGGPSIKHLDDVPAEEMLRFKFKDGRTASIWEKWIEQSPNHFAFYNEWDPGAMTPQHGHHGDHVNFILRGEIRSAQGDVCGPGTHIMLEYGDLFGPWVAGPEGCALYGFSAGKGWSYPGDPQIWQDFLAQHEAEVVPIPRPKRMSPWRLAELSQRATTKWVEE